MTFLKLALFSWLCASVLMLVLFEYQRRSTNATIVDLGWTGCIGVLSVLYACLGAGFLPRRWMAAFMGLVWSLRLLLHLYTDRFKGRQEDGRYRNLRERWKEKAQRNFFLFFQAQAFLAVVFSLPFLAVTYNSTPGLRFWDAMGFLIWLASIWGEAAADRRLHLFRKDPANRGKTCRQGLWRYSRHPNYFFEWLHWWSYVFMAVGTPWVWLNLAFPPIMLFFLFKVTGIPETEAHSLRSRGEDYRRYQQTTSVFIPWFLKKEPS